MKTLLSLWAIIMVFAISNHAVAGGHRGGYGRHHFGFYGGMNYGYRYGSRQYAGGYGGQRFVVSGYDRDRFHNLRRYGGYDARYRASGSSENEVIYGGGYEPEQIYVYRPAPITFYSYEQIGNCCPCQQW